MPSFPKLLKYSLFLLLYLISTVPVGLFLYSLKSESGINIFSKTGYHAYVYCLKEQISKTGE